MYYDTKPTFGKPPEPSQARKKKKQLRNGRVLEYCAHVVANEIMRNGETHVLNILVLAASHKPVCLVVGLDELGAPADEEVCRALCSCRAHSTLQRLLIIQCGSQRSR
eukprot:PhM_4_TR18022/c1_g5_i13/m.93189